MSGSIAIVPNHRIPSVLGILNIIFGSVLLIYSLLVVIWSLASPQLGVSPTVRPAPGAQGPAVQVGAAERKTQPERSLDEIDDSLENDPRLVIPFWSDHALSIVLNALMIASGVGLVGLRKWGWRLALAVAALKVVKVIVLTIVALLVTVPLYAVAVRMEWARTQAASGTGAPAIGKTPTEIAEITAAMSAVSSVGLGMASLVYPLISLWLLRKRSVRAAFVPPKQRIKDGSSGEAPMILVQ